MQIGCQARSFVWSVNFWRSSHLHLFSNSDITEDCPYWEKEMGIYFFQSLKSDILLCVSYFSNL